MQVYELRFCQRNDLMRAFSNVRDCSFVEDCLVDTCNMKLRFRSRLEPAARQLYARLQLEGGDVARPLGPRPPTPIG